MKMKERLSLAAGALLLVSLSGCLYDEVSADYAHGVNVYNFFSKETPVQIIAFENGLPAALRDVLIDGTPVEFYKRPVVGGIPVRRDEKGAILALSYHGSERHVIKFSDQADQYTMPLSDKQLRKIFGNPLKVDRRKRKN